ncbi:glutaredoxin family protein [Dactylosporangium sp. NPDC051485]|uniref:glutaredoxin family protein n=1 Tax=Dactylosporangium sp. NPDC051485 TaxID=3154846 RepID=UPI0034260C94
MRLLLYTREGCHLCEEAREVLERVGEPFEEVDISGDDELEEEYGFRIPVLLLDGKEHGYWRVEEDRLRADLGLSSPG